MPLMIFTMFVHTLSLDMSALIILSTGLNISTLIISKFRGKLSPSFYDSLVLPPYPQGDKATFLHAKHSYSV